MIAGRTAELQRLNVFLTAIPSGPAALLLEGELGAGKTTLWRVGVEEARRLGFRVLAARPAESETSLAFAALGDLAADVDLAGLPGPQRHALEVALFRVEPDERGAPQRAIALGLLALLAAEPTVLAVDDVQWLDRPSETVLAFVARRHRGVLLARRGGGPAPLGLEDVVRVPVGPLGELELARMLGVSRPEAARLHRASGGNPFFALELHEHGGVPEDLRVLVADRLAALSPAGREAAEIASALSRPTTALVDAAAASGVLEVDDARARATAERAGGASAGRVGGASAPGPAAGGGLAGGASPRGGRLADGASSPGLVAGVGGLAGGASPPGPARVRFSHPLLATVAYEGVPDKRALHARLAALVDEPEERARHLAAAAAAPDEAVALALDDAARRARARGAPDAAAALLEQARRLTPGPGWRRGVEAAERHLEAGDAERANALLEEVLDEVPAGRDRAYALARLGWVRAHRDGFRVAADVFRAALAEDPDDVALTIEIEHGLSWCMHSVESVSAARPHAQRALALAEQLGEPTLLAYALSHVAFLDATGGGAAMATIERALEVFADPGWTQILGRPDWIHAMIVLWDGRLAEARARLAALREEANERGDEHSLPFVLFQLARVELLLGEWSLAQQLSVECAESALQSGQVGEFAYVAAIETLVAAHTGDVEGARRHFDEGIALAEARGVQPAALELLAARGFLELSLGDAAAADAVFEEIRTLVDASGLREPALFRCQADAIEAKVLLGRHEEARALFDALDMDRPWVRSVAERCAALVGADREAGERGAADADDSRGAAGSTGSAGGAQPFERARTLLVLGSRERRNRQWRAAREMLGEALATFEVLGAPLWAEKARGELARVGGRAVADGLTETERQIAELIAAGRTYREAADALFISPKTVQWNLSKVYKKLGIRSRAELPGVLGD